MAMRWLIHRIKSTLVSPISPSMATCSHFNDAAIPLAIFAGVRSATHLIRLGLQTYQSVPTEPLSSPKTARIKRFDGKHRCKGWLGNRASRTFSRRNESRSYFRCAPVHLPFFQVHDSHDTLSRHTNLLFAWILK